MSDVFISYSHQDKPLLEKLKRHFAPFKEKVAFWDDTYILPGQKWKEEIMKALSNCKVAILLVSADFFNSKFISEVELPQLLKSAENKGTTILTVILKPCLFSEFEDLNKYQAVNSPNYTIIQMPEYEQEVIWMKLALRAQELSLK